MLESMKHPLPDFTAPTRQVHIREVGPRDGLQIEPKILTIDEKHEFVRMLGETGLQELEIGSFVNPAAVPQMADSDELFRTLNKRPGITYRAIWLNKKGLLRALANHQVDIDPSVSVTASDTFVRRNTNRGIEATFTEMPGLIEVYKRTGHHAGTLVVMAAFGCNFEGRLDERKTLGLVERAVTIAASEGFSVNEVSLADTMGWASPNQVKRLVWKLQDRWPHITVKLHLHDTRGMAIANAVAGLEAGVRAFDAAVGGLGGCPFAGHQGAAGNICTEDLIQTCHEMGFETGVDLKRLTEVSRHVETLLGRSLPGKVMKGGMLPRN